MQWDEKSKDCFGLEHCETPDDLRYELLSSYRMSEAEKITKTKRELTKEENSILEGKYKSYIEKYCI